MGSFAGRPLRATVDIHPEDAAVLGLGDGQAADVTSRRGSLRLAVHVTSTVPSGAVFVPYHAGGGGDDRLNVNVLTHRAFDAHAMQPEYKYGCVRIEAGADAPR